MTPSNQRKLRHIPPTSRPKRRTISPRRSRISARISCSVCRVAAGNLFEDGHARLDVALAYRRYICDGRTFDNSHLAIKAAAAIGFPAMSPDELIAFRNRRGWSRAELARQLDISPSRIADYEKGSTRGRNPAAAPIPKLVDLACRFLGGERAPSADAERLGDMPDRLSPAERSLALAQLAGALAGADPGPIQAQPALQAIGHDQQVLLQAQLALRALSHELHQRLLGEPPVDDSDLKGSWTDG
jgi:transcriptional regulator with XRE-family HTH domain